MNTLLVPVATPSRPPLVSWYAGRFGTLIGFDNAGNVYRVKREQITDRRVWISERVLYHGLALIGIDRRRHRARHRVENVVRRA